MQITAEFDKLVMESTDDFVTTLGEGVKVLFFSCLKQDLNLSRNDVPERLNDFCKEPTDLFGIGVTPIILFMENPYAKLNSVCEKSVLKEGVQ